MKLNKLLLGLVLGAMFWAFSSPAGAQQAAKVPRIGLLSPASDTSRIIEAFRQGLRERGYIEGQNINIEYRYAEGKPERLPALVTELVNLNVDAIVTSTTPAIQAAKQATKTIPIVMANVGDPIAAGFVTSLARPGGNITGLTNLSPTLGGKRLELLKEVFPKLFRVAVFWNPDAHAPALKELEIVGRSLRVQLQPVDVRGANDFDGAFEAATKARADALITLPTPFLVDQRTRIAALAIKKRLPAIYPNRQIADAGGLMSYGPDILYNFYRAAAYVDMILKGTKPGDLPVENPMKFELVINLKTAKQIGLTIPPEVLMRADRVIK